MDSSAGNDTIVTYIAEPNGRGTIGLLLSCLLTLILCVWSALHLNVPQRGVGTFQSLLLNIRWIVTGVFGPELVAFTAWRQWCAARFITQVATEKKILKLEPQTNRSTSLTNPNDGSKDTAHSRWTMAHSFYAIGGGFAFEVGTDEHFAQFMPRTCPLRLTLTARGIALLIRCGYVPSVSEKELWDKSKGNNLTKALVLIQALWMLFQICGRLIVHLPVTLLEINTAAHILCVVLIYAMWWNKPLSVNEAIILKGDWTEEMCAYMYMCSQVSGNHEFQHLEGDTRVKTFFAGLDLYSKSAEVESLTYKSVSCSATSCEGESRTCSIKSMPPNTGSFRLATKKSLDRLFEQQIKDAASMAFFERRPKVKSEKRSTSLHDTVTNLRWELAAKAIEKHPVLLNEAIHLDGGSLHLKSQEYLVEQVSNWPQDDLVRTVDGLVVGMILWLASFVYGAMHAAAWEAYFPTAIEMWLWRASSVYVSFCGGLWVLLNWIAKIWPPLDNFWNRWVDGRSTWWQYLLILPWVLICGLSFFLARGYLVVEAFISLRRQPLSAYDTPNWSQAIPHL